MHNKQHDMVPRMIGSFEQRLGESTPAEICVPMGAPMGGT